MHCCECDSFIIFVIILSIVVSRAKSLIKLKFIRSSCTHM